MGSLVELNLQNRISELVDTSIEFTKSKQDKNRLLKK